MFIEVYVTEGANASWSLTRMFEALDTPTLISKVMAPDPDGRDRTCEVTGWASSGPCAVYAVLVSDSGEGSAMLIYGGDQGIRLKIMEDKEPWDLESPHQWGEPCLLLDKDAEVE